MTGRLLRQSVTWLLILVISMATLAPLVAPAAAHHFRPKVVQTESGTTWRGSRDDCRSAGSKSSDIKGRLVVVKPVLTTTPYSTSYSGVSSFYSFFVKYKNTTTGGVVGSDLGWLQTPVSLASTYNDGWGTMFPVYKYLSTALNDGCGNPSFGVLSDIDVDGGRLFTNGSRNYDVAILGKSEYVTRAELNQFTQFVKSGGRLLLMDSDDFQVEVKLTMCPTLCESFVNGHGWTSIGPAVHSKVWNAFPGVDSKLIGSSLPELYDVGPFIGPGKVSYGSEMGSLLYQRFGQVVLAGYAAHEENRVVNSTGTSVLIGFQFGIDSLVHRYGQGDVVCFCLEGSRILASEPVARYFLMLSIETWGGSSGLKVTSVLGAGQPRADSAGSWMRWRNESPATLNILMVSTAVNSEGQTVAVGESVPASVPPNGTIALQVLWDRQLPSMKGLVISFFIVTDRMVSVSVEISSPGDQFAGG